MLASLLKAKKLLKVFHDDGFEAYIVGGAVRDLLLDRHINDIDIATSARPEQVQKLFTKILPVGIEHGTVIVRFEHRNYEVTTFRSESNYRDYRHPECVRFETSILEDLKRRDFTMNAIALSIDDVLIDPYGGQHDLGNKIIRTVNNPEDRFREDPLRILRGLRFASQLGFAIPADQVEVITDCAPLIKNISIERIFQEFTKMLAGKALASGMPLLIETNCYHFLPLLETKTSELLSLSKLDLYCLESDWERWCALAIVLEIQDIKGFCGAWKMSKHHYTLINKHVIAYFSMKDKLWDRVSLYHASLTSALVIERIRGLFEKNDKPKQTKSQLKTLWDDMPIHEKKDIKVSGDDLITWSTHHPGPWIAEVLMLIEIEILHGRLRNNREDTKEWLMACQKPKFGF